MKRYLKKACNIINRGKGAEAAECCQAILHVQPNHSEALHLSGLLAESEGNLDLAVRLISKAIYNSPENPSYYVSLGHLFGRRGRTRQTISCYEKALNLNPESMDVHTRLGNLFKDMKQLDKAAFHYLKAMEIKPELAGPCYNMGNLLNEQGRSAEAAEYYKRAIKLEPAFADAYLNLGNIHKMQHDSRTALRYYQNAVRQNPRAVQPYLNMAITLKDQGWVREAIKCYQKALDLAPDSAEIHSDLLFCMHYDFEAGPKEIFYEAKRWYQRHGEPLRSLIQRKKSFESGGKLRIGYVSPDFRMHSVSFFFLPLLTSHNRQKFEVFCYSNVKKAR